MASYAENVSIWWRHHGILWDIITHPCYRPASGAKLLTLKYRYNRDLEKKWLLSHDCCVCVQKMMHPRINRFFISAQSWYKTPIYITSSHGFHLNVKSAIGTASVTLDADIASCLGVRWLYLLTWIITLIPTWMSYYMHYKVWDEIAYLFPNFNDAAVEV